MFRKSPDVSLGDSAFSKNLKGVVAALNEGASPNSLRDPLFTACQRGFESIAELLIMRGASVDGVNLMETRPLLTAVVMCHKSIVQLLLRQKAEVNFIDANQCKTAIPYYFDNGEFERIDTTRITPLGMAVLNKDTECVKLLLEHQADPNLKSESGKSALEFAEYCRNLEILNLLKATERKSSTPMS